MIIKILEEIHVDKTVVLLIIEAEHSHTVTAIISPRKLICRTPGMNMTPFDTMTDLGSADFPGGRGRCQEYSVVSLNMKNLMSPTPRN